MSHRAGRHPAQHLSESKSAASNVTVFSFRPSTVVVAAAAVAGVVAFTAELPKWFREIGYPDGF